MDLRWCGATMREATVDAAAWLAMVGTPLLLVIAAAASPRAGRRIIAMARGALRLAAFIEHWLARREVSNETRDTQEEKAADRQFV
ncbi:hypothetical protein ACFC58_03390 [Kitasatospora purpeofusca]|uniref:hypothetical protein n=1 Tax=Kitasatospora purpeofusca TaxID=67352 RepID=UPI0035D5674F